MSTGIITERFFGSAIVPRLCVFVCVTPGFSPVCRPKGRRYEISSSLRRALERVSLHGVERIRRVRKPTRREMLFQLPQKRIALVVACKFNSHSAFIVRRVCRFAAKFTHSQPPHPRQRRPAHLIDHGWLLLRGRKTK